MNNSYYGSNSPVKYDVQGYKHELSRLIDEAKVLKEQVDVDDMLHMYLEKQLKDREDTISV